MSTERPTDNASGAEQSADGGIVARLPALDRFLPVWLLAAMAGGLLAGRLIPGLGGALGALFAGVAEPSAAHGSADHVAQGERIGG